MYKADSKKYSSLLRAAILKLDDYILEDVLPKATITLSPHFPLMGS